MTKPRTAPYTNTWKTLQNTLYWCKLKLAQVRGLQFYQTRSHAIVLYGTLLVVCIKKAVCMKTEEELYLKVRLRLPRVVLEANSHSGQQDQRDQDARSSCDPPSESKSRTTGCKSTKKVKQLIEKFENHQHKESFCQDLSQTQKINKLSKESEDLIAEMNNTEIFELCENSSEQQCTDCNTYWEISIVFCSCGRKTTSSQRPKEFEKNNNDVSSILGYLITENSSRGAKHGPSEQQKNVLRGLRDAAKSSPRKPRKPLIHTCTMAQWLLVQKFVVTYWVCRAGYYAI